MVTTKTFYGVDLSGTDEPATTDEMRAVFELLKPKASKTPLIRIGGDQDGSYLVPDELDGIAACFSPGVNRIKYFEDFLTDNYGIASHMCDFSCDVDEFKTPLRPGSQTFVKKWLDVEPGEDNVSLEDWIRDNDADGDLILQMDIEGAEYRNILATSDQTLARFRVIVLEVHTLSQMLHGPTLRSVIAPFFEKLAASFTTIHAHPNNCCGDFEVPGTDIRIPNVLELTLVRNDRFVPEAGPAALPHPLDVQRNVPRNPPLFLSDAWCDYERPLESRILMLETMAEFNNTVGPTMVSDEIASVLALTMQSVETAARTGRGGRRPKADLDEVAAGRPYQLSSAYGSSSRTGVVEPRGSYFFHTRFGPNQSIRVDLGEARQVRRIVVSNRQDGHQQRARYIFASLSGGRGKGARVFPMYKTGRLPGGAWMECSIELPDVSARYVTITSPANTALHFSDLKVYALPLGSQAAKPTAARSSRLRGAARRAARRLRRIGTARS